VQEVDSVEIVEEDRRSTVAASGDVEETVVQLAANDPRHAAEATTRTAHKRPPCAF
jgi:hypothetical protein